jgi:hypothetical protein
MSTKSKARNVKSPTGSARAELKKTLANMPARQVAARLDGTRNAVPPVTLAFKDEPGHRDLGLIRRKVKGIRVAPEKPATKGAFGGVTKTERRRRQAAKELADLEKNAAFVA